MALQYSARLIDETFVDLIAGSVSHDGKVDSSDAAIILQVDAGLIRLW